MGNVTRSSVLVAALFAAAWAGCIDGGTTTEDLLVFDEEPGAGPSVTVGGESCHVVGAMFLVDFGVTDPWLPPGYHPRDLSDVLSGYQVAPGKVPIIASGVRCQDAALSGAPAAMGAVAILVESPVLPQVDQAADLDLYVVRFHTDDPVHAEHWLQYGGAAETFRLETEIASHVVNTPGAPWSPFEATLEATAGDDPSFRFNMQGGTAQDLEDDQLIRNWHQTPNGTYYETGTLPANSVITGTLSDCHVAPESIIHDILGSVRCPEDRPDGPVATPYQQAVMVRQADLVMESSYLPGAFPV